MIDLGLCFLFSFAEMGVLTTIIVLAAVLHQSTGQVGAFITAKDERIVKVSDKA